MAEAISMRHRLLDEHQYALIDQAIIDKLPVDIVVPLIPSALQAQPHLLPVLINLTTLSKLRRDELWEQLYQEQKNAQPLTVCALLKSAQNERTINNHLTRCLIARPMAGETILWRFYDGRVFRHLSWLLNDAQLRQLLGPIDTWTYFSEGGWHEFLLPHVEVGVSNNQAPKLEPHQWKFIGQAGKINNLLLHENGHPAQWEEKPLQERARLLSGYLDRAEHYGLTRREDFLIFATHCIQVSERFDQHPIIKNVFTELRSDPELSYRDAIQPITDTAWREIAHGTVS